MRNHSQVEGHGIACRMRVGRPAQDCARGRQVRVGKVIDVSMSAEETYWRDQVVAARHGQLEMVRKAATGWSALFGGLLGIFGTVAFAGGLPTMEDLPDRWRPWLVIA